MALVHRRQRDRPHGDGAAAPPTGSNTRALGQLLYVDYVYPFEIAAVVLLVAIVAAIALTHRERKERKHQDPGRQVKVRREDRVRLRRPAVGETAGLTPAQ